MAKNDKEQGFIGGCPNPYSVAEAVAGKRINWSKKKDVFETMAECFGITRDGYMSDDSPLQSPFIDADENGNLRRLSDEEAEKRLVEFLEKHARPEKKKRKKATPNEGSTTSAGTVAVQKLDAPQPQEMTQAEKRKRAVSVLLMKDNAEKPQKVSTKATMAKKVSRTKQTAEASVSTLGELCERVETPPEKNDGPHTPAGMKWDDKGYFFNEYVAWQDVCQNAIGDCYFLAALCSVAYVNPFYIQNKTARRFKFDKPKNSAKIESQKGGSVQHDTPWHAIDFYVPNTSNSGCESAIAWKDKKGTIQHIVVSEEVLVYNSNGNTYGACGSTEAELRFEGRTMNGRIKQNMDSCWAAVYEKAYAKFLERTTTDMPDMTGIINNGGFAEYALKEILHTEKVEKKYLADLSVDEIWKIAMKASTHPTCCSIYQYTRTDSNGQKISYSEAGTKSEYMENFGLHIGHVYSLFGTVSMSAGGDYVIIRDPHATLHPGLKNNPKVYHKPFSTLGFGYPDNNYHDNKFSISRSLTTLSDPTSASSRGIFLMEVDEFKRLFTTIEYYTDSSFENYL